MQAFDVRSNFIPDQLDLQLEVPVLEEAVSPYPEKATVIKPMTLAEQVEVVQDDINNEVSVRHFPWFWALTSLLLLLLLLVQAAYFFRVDLAARIPQLRPVLTSYCQILRCSVPLPQHLEFIGIESSDLEAVPNHANQLVLNALLRNRAPYMQAFPDLELTLNDNLDRPVARRMFHATDYLPIEERQAKGLLPNYEINVRLQLDIGELNPMGYRLVLFYVK